MTFLAWSWQISRGFGSSSSLSSEVSESSSSMISLHRSMHSSQMYTPGPAMSFLTCFCDLPQKEHFSRSESPNFAIYPGSRPFLPATFVPPAGPGHRPAADHRRILRGSGRRRSQFRTNLPAREDLVDHAVLLGLLGRHDEVAVGVVADLLDRLARVLSKDLVEELPVPQDLLGLDLDVDGLALRAAVGLVDQHAGVRKGEALAPGPRRQDHCGRRGGLAHHDGRHVAPYVLHGVVHGEQRRDVPARRVDVQVDVLVRVLGLEEQELGHDQVADLVVDRCPEEHDPLLEEPAVDVERALAAVRLLDDDGNQIVLHFVAPWLLPVEWSGASVPSGRVSAGSSEVGPLSPSAASTRRSRALDRMISPASEVTCPVRSMVLATSFGSRPRAWARSWTAEAISSAVTVTFSWRAIASSTRSDLMARVAWARASLRNRSSSHSWASSTCSRVSPARSARRVASCTRCSVSWSTSRSGSSMSTWSTSARSSRSRNSPRASAALASPSFSRRSSRSSWKVTSSPTRSPNRSGRTALNLRICPAVVLSSSSSSLGTSCPLPTSYSWSGRVSSGISSPWTVPRMSART